MNKYTETNTNPYSKYNKSQDNQGWPSSSWIVNGSFEFPYFSEISNSIVSELKI